MKVVIAVGGIWDAFRLAGHLERRGDLLRIVTSHPRFVVDRRGVKHRHLVTLGGIELVTRAHFRLGLPGARFVRRAKLESFDLAASRLIDGADVVVCFAGMARHTLRRARKLGIPTVLFRNSCHIEYQSKVLKEEYARYGLEMDEWDPWAVQRELDEYELADYIRTPSQFAHRTFIDRGFSDEKVFWVRHGVDIHDFTPAPKEDDRFRVLFVAGMTLRKGFHYLLEATRTLELPETDVWLIGGMSEETRRILSRFPDGYRTFGRLPHQELFRYYSQASVYVLPTLEEGMAATVIEAMACGVPVLVTEGAGVQGIVREGVDGFIVPNRDVSSLVDRIRWFREHQDEARQMGQNALARAKEVTWDGHGEMLAAKLLEIAKRGRNAG